MLALVYYGAFISVIELNKLKDVGPIFKCHCVQASIGILGTSHKCHVLFNTIFNIFYSLH